MSRRFPSITADKTFLKQQNDILKLLVRIQQPNYYDDLVQIGKSYDIESNINNYKVNRYSYQFYKFRCYNGQSYTLS
jgi:hypothetical protein